MVMECPRLLVAALVLGQQDRMGEAELGHSPGSLVDSLNAGDLLWLLSEEDLTLSLFYAELNPKRQSLDYSSQESIYGNCTGCLEYL